MSLSVCLLTRNEAATVAGAIESVRSVADEILVADTGSTDGTADVASAAGASVSQFVWEDDFAAGRNHLVERATGDWILWLDAKEQLTSPDSNALQAMLAQPTRFGFFVRVQHFAASTGGKLLGEASDLRLVRRRADLRYVGRLHPHLEPAVVEAVAREGFTLGASDMKLRHAEDRSPSEPKLRWTLRLIELELRDRAGQLHYLIEMARTLIALKDPRGAKVMAEAASQLLATRDAPRAPSAKVQTLLGYALTQKPAGFPIDTAVARELALKWFGNSPSLLWAIAHEHFGAGEYAKAAETLERLVGLGKSGGKWDRTQPFPPEILGGLSVINLGKCYQQLGRRAEAEACFLQLTADPKYGAEANRLLTGQHSTR